MTPTTPPEESRRGRRTSSSSSAHGAGGGTRPRPVSAPHEAPGWEGLLDNTTLGLLGGVALLLAAEAPGIPDALRSGTVIVGAAVLLLTLGACRAFAEDMRRALLRGPAPVVLLLVLWAFGAFAWSPFRAQAAADLTRVVAGAAAFFLAGYALPQGRQLGRAAGGLLLMGVLLSVWDLSQVAKIGGIRGGLDLNRYSAFGTHENVGSLLVLLLPPALALSISSTLDEKPRFAAQFAAVVLGFALLVARTRSAWIATVVAVLVLAVLALAFGHVQRGRGSSGGKGGRPGRGGRRTFGDVLSGLIGSPAVLVLAGFAFLVAAGGIVPQLTKRAATLSGVLEDGSFAARLTMWDAGARMALERPLTGWGLGSYFVDQGRWTHAGLDRAEVLTSGAGHENVAHNYYVQWAADAGAVGLLLHGAVIAAFLLSVAWALRRRGTAGEPTAAAADTPLRRALAIGAAAAVVGAAVDAAASPAYNFAGVSTVFWAWMGIGIGALRAEPPRRGLSLSDKTPAAPDLPALPARAPWSVWAGGALFGAALAAAVLGWGLRSVRAGEGVPRGSFRVVTDTPAVVEPGTPVTWKAIFVDEKGVEQDTMPGTSWGLTAEPPVRQAPGGLVRADWRRRADNTLGWERARSALRITVPAVFSPITVEGTYIDRYSRRYRFASSVLVRAGAASDPAAKPLPPSAIPGQVKGRSGRPSANSVP